MIKVQTIKRYKSITTKHIHVLIDEYFFLLADETVGFGCTDQLCWLQCLRGGECC